MTIFKTSDSLPDTADQYFEEYKHRAYTQLVGEGDLDNILTELRLAYKKYPEHQTRINAIANVLKSGKNAPLPKTLRRTPYKNTTNKLEKNIIDTLL